MPAAGEVDYRLEEWKMTREVLKQFDERIHDLRKFGFTAITTLLTISSFLLPAGSVPIPGGGIQALPDRTKVAAIGAIMLLVVALRYVERNYQVFQKATAIRALILERSLNLELTGSISFMRARDKLWHADVLYFLFASAAFFLGLAAVPPGILWLPLTVLILVAAIALYLMATHLKFSDIVHLGIDRLQCSRGEFVTFTVTVLGEDEPFEPGSLALPVEKENGTPVNEFRWPDKEIANISAWKVVDEFSAPARQFYVCFRDIVSLKRDAIKRGLAHPLRFVSQKFMGKAVCFLREKGARRAARKVRSIYSGYPASQPHVPDLIWLGEMDSYSWRWDTTKFDAGVYRVSRYGRKPKPQWRHPTSIRIVLSAPAEDACA